MNELFELLSFPFVQRALVVGVLVSLCSALLGVTLVLKRYSMIGDGLSHVGFGALSVAVAFGLAPFAVSVPVVCVAAFLLLRLSESSKVKGDAAIAMISTGALAVGYIVISKSASGNADVCNFMFGSINSLSGSDVVLSIILSVLVILAFLLLYERLFTVTFDESFARASGTPSGLINIFIALLTAVTVVLGMRMMGTLLISALIVFPALSAMKVFRSFRGVVLCSAAVSVFCFLAGYAVSVITDTPSGAMIVCANIVVFAIFSVIGRSKSSNKALFRSRRRPL